MINTYKGGEYYLVCPSNRPHMVKEVKRCLPGFNITHFDGTGYRSYAKLANDMITSSTCDITMIVNDKIRPSAPDVFECLDHQLSGYAMSWLWPFAFGSIHKDVIRRLGFFEERCSDGHYEDSDMIRRCREADFGIVMLHKTARVSLNTQWSSKESERFFKTKWGGPNEMNRLIPEQGYPYDIGVDTGTQFRKWAETLADAHPPATAEDNRRYLAALGL